jgi:hypothetical protein
MKSNIASQITDSRIQYDDTGAMFRIFDFDEQNSIDSIVIRFDPDDDVPPQLRVYEDGDTESPTHTMGFETRQEQFTPISVIGKGQSEKLFGVTPSVDSYEDVPDEVQVAWNAIGFAVVPQGDDWLR